MSDKKALAQMIRNRRRELNLTQQELAKRMELKATQIGLIEKGDRVSLKKQIDALRALGLKVFLTIEEMDDTPA